MTRQSPYSHADGSSCWTKNCSKNNTNPAFRPAKLTEDESSYIGSVVRHHLSPVIGWMRMDASAGYADLKEYYKSPVEEKLTALNQALTDYSTMGNNRKLAAYLEPYTDAVILQFPPERIGELMKSMESFTSRLILAEKELKEKPSF
jgi:hypothetical protein